MSSTFFSSIGKPKKGTFLSLTRQIIFLLPLLVILPLFLGIDGIMYAGPIADCLAAVISGIFLAGELKKWVRKLCNLRDITKKYIKNILAAYYWIY